MLDKFISSIGLLEQKWEGDDQVTFRETPKGYGPEPDPSANGMFTQLNSNSISGSPPHVFLLAWYNISLFTIM